MLLFVCFLEKPYVPRNESDEDKADPHEFSLRPLELFKLFDKIQIIAGDSIFLLRIDMQ